MDRRFGLHAALDAARRGWFVFPLRPGRKSPVVDRWEQRATRDDNVIRRWWSDSSRRNVGIACGPSGLHVIDLDGSASGERSSTVVLAELARTASQPLPVDTFTVATPHGLHLYFTAPEQPHLRNTVARLGPHIDSRGWGGYVVAAGSASADGVYRVANPAPPAPMPGWLAAALAPPPRPVAAALPPRIPSAYLDAIIRNETAAVTAATPGTRHVTLLHAACSLGRLVGGSELDRQTAEALLHAAAAAHIGDAGFTAAEATRTIADGLNWGARRPRKVTRRLSR